MIAARQPRTLGHRVGRRLALSATILLAVGCSATLPEYEEQRDRWTRSRIFWDGFVANATVHATLKTASFRDAYVKEYARLFSLTARQRERLLAAELTEAQGAYVIMVALHTNELDWNKLHPRDGIWAVRLENSKNDYVNATNVKRLDPRNPTWPELYPWVDTQFTFWQLTFPKTMASGTPLAAPGELLELIVAGAPAQIRLKWKAPVPTALAPPATNGADRK